MDSAEYVTFQEKALAAVTQVIRTASHLASEDLDFHRTNSSDVTEALDEQTERILTLTSAVLKAATNGTDLQPPTLENEGEDSLDDKNWRDVVDVIDTLLEKADACLDEFTGVIKKLSPPVRKAPTFPTTYDYGPSKIPKPQLNFDHKADNSDLGPFRPLLKSKPHATVPLERSLQTQEIGGKEAYPSPYEAEIRASKYPKAVYEISPPVDYLPFEDTTATWVDTFDGVKEMLAELKEAKEIAIDLEHHDVHSYHGLVSLMQISTRNKDWIVDTLKPWRQELQILNEVFADPKILKVLHGSKSDIIWLQRDLGLYMVGMFDTFYAASALGYQKKSLKYLLQKIVNFEANKQYQMADWRIRPLEAGMFDYARSDTHYLLYIYDHLRNELIEASEPDNSLIDYVNERSQNEALQRYERPVYDEKNGYGQGGWYELLTRNSGVLSKEQFAVFKAVHKWRDEVARAEDEGSQCVFPKHVLFRLAQTMPNDMGTLLRTVSPMTPITKERIDSLLDTIKEAKVAGATGPEWRDVLPPPKAAPRAVLPVAEPYEKSQFWGTTLDARQPPKPLEYALNAFTEAIRLSLPLPPMPSTVSEAREKFVDVKVSSPKAEASPVATPQAPEEKKIFTVKELGGPRKRKVTPVEKPEKDVLTLDGMDYTDDEESEAMQRKKARKEKKRKAKEAAQAQADSTPLRLWRRRLCLTCTLSAGPWNAV
ncbi:hypothetical protein N7490_004280 [Penicillium lividum]|nr:hypothetical protein N7490_004280 [Penicillium lividum]